MIKAALWINARGHMIFVQQVGNPVRQLVQDGADVSAVEKRHGLTRDVAMTSSEFARRLEMAGLPSEAVHTLTRLFESVRYGARRSTADEIDQAVKENLAYLSSIRKAVRVAAKRKNPLDALAEVDIESCGKSRVYLGGLAEELHRRNLKALYRQILDEEQSNDLKIPVGGE